MELRARIEELFFPDVKLAEKTERVEEQAAGAIVNLLSRSLAFIFNQCSLKRS